MNIAEQYVLLALHDERGTVHMNAMSAYPYALAGAILTELAACRAIDYKDKKVIIHDSCESDDHVFRQVHTFMKRKNKTKNMKHWVYQIGSYVQRQKFDRTYYDRFVEAGVLKKEEKKVLFFFRQTVYPSLQTGIEESIRDRLRLQIRQKEFNHDGDLILLSLLQASHLDDTLFSKEEYRLRKKEIKALMNDPVMMGKHVSAVVSEIQTAVMASVVAVSAAAITTSSTNSN